MSKIAIIRTGGKQYLVKEGDKLKIEKLADQAGEPLAAGAKVDFETLFTASDDAVEIGMPILDAKIPGEVTAQGHAKTVIGIKYKRKTRQHKKFGHRQKYTEVLIGKI